MKLVAITSVSIVTLLLLAGCGGGGGGEDPEGVPGQTVVDGWWEYLVRDGDSSGDYELDSIVLLRQEGAQVELQETTLTRDGRSLAGAYPSFDAPARVESRLTVASVSLIEGTRVTYSGGAAPVTEELLLRRIPQPDGIFTANGQAWDGPLDVHSTSAYAIQEPAGSLLGWVRTTIVDLSSGHVEELSFAYFALGGSSVLDLGSVYSAYQHGQLQESGVAGTLTFASSQPGRISGSYQITVLGGRTITGVFDVPVLIER